MPDIEQAISGIYRQVVTIPAGQSASASLAIKGLLISGLRFNATSFTGTALTLEESTDAVTWSPIRIKDESADYSITPVTSKTIVFDSAVPLSAFEYVRFVSNGTEAAERTFTLLCRPA